MINFLSKIFGLAVKRRNKLFDLQKKDKTHCDCHVISVGNLSVGGTGKTPFTEMLSKELKKLNRKPGIIGRGYKRKSKGEIIVSDGKNLLETAERAGDEMLFLAHKCKVPVIANESKSKAAVSINDKFDVNVIIVDDGFQHRQLHRDIDIVLVDNDTVEKPFLLPKGRLREPLENIKRADIVCFMGDVKNRDEIEKHLDHRHLIIEATGKCAKPKNFFNRKAYLPKGLKSQTIAFAGIANPERFKTMLESQAYKLKDYLSFSDHHNYTVSDIQKIIANAKKHSAENIITTEKDAVKLFKYKDFFYNAQLNLFVLPFYIEIVKGKKQFMDMLQNIYINE